MTPEQHQDIQIRLNCLSLATQAFNKDPEKILKAANDFFIVCTRFCISRHYT